MKMKRAVATWFFIMGLETVNGTLRTIFLVPAAGALHAHQAGVAIACVIIFTITWFTAEWIGSTSFRQHLKVGGLWLLLTLLFEFGLGALLNYGPDRMIADYDLSRGGLMGFGLTFITLAPALVAWLRGVFRPRAHR
ncbi:MAG TPA: hypothetical protein VN367_08405 [Chlorobaculum sp.]|nr:hypothetical protein [Chlorobaculum sp.]